MRAARIHEYGPPDVLRLDEVPVPTTRPRDVLIAVHASSVNPVDTKIRSGSMRGAILHRLPWTLGLDASGVVVAVGPRVRGFRVGDEVFSSPTHRRQGCWADFVAIDERAVAKKPKNVSHDEAASLPLVALTAWEALVRWARVKRGERVLIHAGAGGVGTVAIQLAKHLGAHVATTCSAKNVDFVRALGADQAVDYTTTKFDEVLDGYDVVLDALGGETKVRSLSVLRRGGRLVSIAADIPTRVKQLGPRCGIVAAGWDIASFAARARVSHGIRAWNVQRRSEGSDLAQIAKLVEAGVLRACIDRVLPLEEAAEANRLSEGGRTRGKVVLHIAR